MKPEKGGKSMRHKQLTALLLSVIIAVSSGMPAGMQAYAAEGTAVEDNGGQIPEETPELGESFETEDSDSSAAAEPAATDGESEEETENAAALVTSEGGAASEEEPGQETENASSGVTEEEAIASEEEAEAETSEEAT